MSDLVICILVVVHLASAFLYLAVTYRRYAKLGWLDYFMCAFGLFMLLPFMFIVSTTYYGYDVHLDYSNGPPLIKRLAMSRLFDWCEIR